MFKSILSEFLNKTSKLVGLTKSFSSLTSKLAKESQKSSLIITKKNFSLTTCQNGLMEFFDKEINWGAEKVIHGREWKLDELRIKSNVDLHKLWFVLLKERNMLLTMEETYKKNYESFVSPERIAKVDSSMENILHVVKERDIAFNLLETGESKEIVPYKRFNSFGYLQDYKPREYYLPWYLNTHWKLKFNFKKLPYWSKYFRNQLAVKKAGRRRRFLKMLESRKEKILIENPEMAEDKEFLKEYIEAKYNLQPEEKYSDLLERPKPDDVPKQFKERPKKKVNVYEDEF